MRIDDMKPGPELNAELAKALGKPNVRKYNYRYVWDNVGYLNGNPVGSVMGTIDVPEYSTTWEGMRLVVEEMQRRGWEFTLYWSDGRDESEQWVCTFSKGVGMNTKHYRAYGMSAPHSTILAAIKALQGEDTQP